MYLENRLASGTLRSAGAACSLAKSPVELYVLSARDDHITPWRGCYRTTQLAGGPMRFVLTSSGHIAGIVNPPGPKRRHWIERRAAGGRRRVARGHDGGAGLVVGGLGALGRRAEAARSGTPPSLGSDAHPPLEDAPGTYVRG